MLILLVKFKFLKSEAVYLVDTYLSAEICSRPNED